MWKQALYVVIGIVAADKLGPKVVEMTKLDGYAADGARYATGAAVALLAHKFI